MTTYWVRQINVVNGKHAEVKARSASEAIRAMTDWPVTETWRGGAAAKDSSGSRAFWKAQPLSWIDPQKARP